MRNFLSLVLGLLLSLVIAAAYRSCLPQENPTLDNIELKEGAKPSTTQKVVFKWAGRLGDWRINDYGVVKIASFWHGGKEYLRLVGLPNGKWWVLE